MNIIDKIFTKIENKTIIMYLLVIYKLFTIKIADE